MQPMRMRAYLLDGRVAGTEPYFPLDSILAAMWIHKRYPELCYQPVVGDFIQADLPFERRGNGESWYWACSFNVAKPIGEYVTYWNRRFDDQYEQYIDFKGKRGKVSASSGRYKAYRTPLNVLLFDYLEWYAVGDIDEVRELVEMVVAIGKKPAQGFGLVDRWEIVPWDDDWSEVRDGKVTRALPRLPDGCRGIIKPFGLRPPYWDIKNKQVVYMPWI